MEQCQHVDLVLLNRADPNPSVRNARTQRRCMALADGDRVRIPDNVSYCKVHVGLHRLPIRTFAANGLETTGFTTA